MFQRTVYQKHPYLKWTHTVEDRAFESLKSGLHYDQSLILTYLVHGTGQLLVEGIDHSIQAGDILILNPKEFHCCRFNQCADHERISMYIGSGFAEEVRAEPTSLYAAFYDREAGHGNIIPASVVQGLHINRLLREIATPQSDESTADYHLGLTCRAAQVLLLLKKAISKMPADSTKMQKNELVIRIINYINEHLQEPLSVSVISAKFFLDKSYLCRTFHKFTGTTLGQYIAGKRVEKAIDMLNAGADCTDACFESGFGNYSSFYKAFKSYTGEEPNDCKNRSKSDNETAK